MNTINAIQTVWNGNKFRSRLEARTAVMLNYMGLDYVYEEEGYEINGGIYYLPDFYVPKLDSHIEVKANTAYGLKEVIEKCFNAISWGGPIKRIIIISEIPEGRSIDGGIWHFPAVFSFDCEPRDGWWFFYDDYENEGCCTGHISASPLPSWRNYGISPETDIALRDKSFYYSGHPKRDMTEWVSLEESINAHTFNAYKIARQARFEYGEEPEVRRIHS